MTTYGRADESGVVDIDLQDTIEWLRREASSPCVDQQQHAVSHRLEMPRMSLVVARRDPALTIVGGTDAE